MSESARLSAKSGAPHFRNLVFTAAGDGANIENWLAGARNFDLWVTYCGSETNRFKYICDYYNVRHGGKFQNLHYAYQTWNRIFGYYEAVMVIDADIIIDATGISRLFQIREEFGLWLLQPAFSPAGRISFPWTCAHPFTKLRYTNSIEMTCPLFLKNKLDDFMNIYSPVMAGSGRDWWFMDGLYPGKAAIVDEVICLDPRTRTKSLGQCIKTRPDGFAEGEGFHTFGAEKKQRIELRDMTVLGDNLLYQLKSHLW